MNNPEIADQTLTFAFKQHTMLHKRQQKLLRLLGKVEKELDSVTAQKNSAYLKFRNELFNLVKIK